ncbi:MAG TPA: hypothetical protein VIL48_06105 [Acidimicrobiales bacterium]
MTAAARARVAVALVVAVGIVAAVAAIRLAGSDGDGVVADPVPDDTLSAAGTALPDGFAVAEGSSLVGPVVVEEVDGRGEPTSWWALLLVEGDPIDVWMAYARQVAERFPGERIDPSQAPGCLAGDTGDGELCALGADTVDGTREARAHARLVSVPGDVTGSYLLTLSAATETRAVEGYDIYEGGGDPWSGEDLPAPVEPRDRPGVGDPLAPATAAYDGDDERYVLLVGSELIAQYGAGSVTGGFDLLLRVAPGADVGAVARAYAEQANQIEGEPIPPPEVVEHDGTTFTTYHPPGGAGGYTGEVIAVDQPGDADDYIRYELYND